MNYKQILFALILFTIYSCIKEMEYKVFTSDSGWFKMNIPVQWSEYEDEDGTYAFFDTTHWTGNFRVTPLKVNEDSVSSLIASEYNENAELNPQKSTINDFEIVSYKEELQNDDDEQIIYYWILGKDEFLFICSFTIDSKNELTKENQDELEKIKTIIHSIKITNS